VNGVEIIDELHGSCSRPASADPRPSLCKNGPASGRIPGFAPYVEAVHCVRVERVL
jgi:hypothetical protein